jgi:hypothetical protein
VIGKHEVMSLKAAVWAEAQPLTGRKKQLLLAIARAVDETGKLSLCDPGRSSCLVRLHGSPGAPAGRGAGSREIPCPPPTRASRWRQSGGFVRAAA